MAIFQGYETQSSDGTTFTKHHLIYCLTFINSKSVKLKQKKIVYCIEFGEPSRRSSGGCTMCNNMVVVKRNRIHFEMKMVIKPD